MKYAIGDKLKFKDTEFKDDIIIIKEIDENGAYPYLIQGKHILGWVDETQLESILGLNDEGDRLTYEMIYDNKLNLIITNSNKVKNKSSKDLIGKLNELINKLLIKDA